MEIDLGTIERTVALVYHIIQAKVIHVSAEERRLGLSIKQIKDEEERRKPKEFHSGPQEAGQSLGDLLKQKFEESENSENS